MNKTDLFKRIIPESGKKIIAGALVLFFGGATGATAIPSETSAREILAQQLKSRKVTLHLKNQSLKNILYELQRQSGVNFAFADNEAVNALKNLSINVKDATIEAALTQLLSNTPLTYTLVGNSVTIVKRAETQSSPVGQNISEMDVRGTVIDKLTKKPISGATIFIEGTTRGTISDAEGNFTIRCKIGQSLRISFIGMRTEKRPIAKGTSHLEIMMESDETDIENVVVTGYGNISKNSFTGNATTVKGEDLLKVSRTNAIKALQVFDPSFRIAENINMGSDPNTLPDVYIRGRSSLGTFELDRDKLTQSSLERNPNTPTFIIDGFEVSLQKVYDLDPNRIQTMTILKDAAATAMYGSRAANGVIVITTVPAQEGKVRVSYSFTSQLEVPDLSVYNLMNSEEKLEAERLSGLFETDNPQFDINDLKRRYVAKYNAVYIEKVYTDWMSLPLRNAFMHKHSASVEGGSEAMRWIFDANYKNDNGVMKGSLRSNGGAGLKLNFKFGRLAILNYASYNKVTSKDSPYGNFSDFSHQLPYAKYHDAVGNILTQLEWSNGETILNPMYEATLHNRQKADDHEFMEDLQLRWNFNTNFFIEGKFSISKQWDSSERFYDPKSQHSTNKISSTNFLGGDLYTTDGSSGRINGKISAFYNRSIERHNLNFSVSGEINENDSHSLSTHYIGFPSGTLSSVNYASEVSGKPQRSQSKSRTAGVSALFNYSYDNIYLLDLSARYEGASSFGSKQRSAPYWAGGIGINIHNYEIMRSYEWLNQLKLRASFGQVGNVNFPAYAAQRYYQTMFDDWYITGYGTKIKYLGNDNLKPETTNTFDVGFNLTVFDNRVNVSGSYYNKTTRDMINDVTVPSSSGFTSYKDNLGKVRNTGYELSIQGVVAQTKDFYLALNGNFATNKNRILEIAQSLKDYNNRVNDYYGSATDYGQSTNDLSKIWTKYEEGNSLTAEYGMRSLGIDPMTGKEIFVDRLGAVVSEWDATQMQNIGDTEPKGQGSLGFNCRYKQFSLTAYFNYEFGGYRYNETLVNYVENAKIESQNVDKRVLTERWQKPGDITPLKDIKDKSATRPSSRFMQKNNVLSLNSISLQYEFSDRLSRSIGMQRLRLEANCSELFRISSVKQERGLDYPFARSFGMSLMANF